MEQIIFLATLGAACAAYLCWGMRTLPRELWQIAAAIPVRKGEDGSWRGINLTWYGILTANAYLVAVGLALVLLAAAGVPLGATALMVGLLLALCVPASRLVAQIVEGKANTFTVGGAVFVGTLLAPWVVELVNRLRPGEVPVPVLPALAAFAIAYAFGEGLGRLACVSFGCCYGKPVSACRPWLARLLSPVAIVFTGSTKKIAYASGLDGVPVLPVQGFTYLLYTVTGILACTLYLRGAYGTAFLTALTVTQAWRVVSEFLREDYRGGGRFSAYQAMGVVAIVYAFWVAGRFGAPASAPKLLAGLRVLWNPVPLLALQLVWVVIFLYTGLSRVTAATMSFHVHTEKI